MSILYLKESWTPQIKYIIDRQYTVSQSRFSPRLLRFSLEAVGRVVHVGYRLTERQSELGERHLSGAFWPPRSKLPIVMLKFCSGKVLNRYRSFSWKITTGPNTISVLFDGPNFFRGGVIFLGRVCLPVCYSDTSDHSDTSDCWITFIFIPYMNQFHTCFYLKIH